MNKLYDSYKTAKESLQKSAKIWRNYLALTALTSHNFRNTILHTAIKNIQCDAFIWEQFSWRCRFMHLRIMTTIWTKYI